MLITIANSMKHLTVMESSLKYIEKNLNLDELQNEKISGISELNKNISHKLRSLCYIIEKLRQTAIKVWTCITMVGKSLH